MAEAITDPRELLRQLELPLSLLPGALAANGEFALRVPRPYLALMRRGDPADPLLRQVLPLGKELDQTPGFTDDPVGDLPASLGDGLLRKYAGRTLVIASPACAVHCRYCFRRSFPYAAHRASGTAWQRALALLRQDRETREVILSGGDPLTLDDGRLRDLIRDLEGLPHLVRLRIHTRLPVVIPSRITDELRGTIEATRLKTAVVLHFNHPNELSPDVASAMALLGGATTLLNQAVLLRGVNDAVDVLQALCERLFDSKILPYYIHLLDRVRGAAHFFVGPESGVRLLTELRARLPGYLVPRLVQEERGSPFKTLLI
jgi:EF-P beta-lysylation protein EpmB